MTDPRSRPRLLLILATLVLSSVALACSSQADDGAGTWTLGPTLAPSSAEATQVVAPSGSVPVGSGAPVASIGPGTSQAPQPSTAP
jgi:hypothetical protein